MRVAASIKKRKLVKKRVYARYEGRVQGVGFRFTTQRIAEDFGLFGWVKNMPDGAVELAIEGEKKCLNGFLAEVNKSLARHISHAKLQWQDFEGEFKGFNIRF